MLVAEGLAKAYDDVVALRSADLRVDAGQIVALLGRNGAFSLYREYGSKTWDRLRASAAYATCLITLLLLLSATFRTVNQLNAFQNVGAMLMGGLGGALVPLEQLPDFAQRIAPITPTYWAMDGLRPADVPRAQ